MVLPRPRRPDDLDVIAPKIMVYASRSMDWGNMDGPLSMFDDFTEGADARGMLLRILHRRSGGHRTERTTLGA